MQPPRWFYPLLAVCAVVLTLSLSGALVSLTYRLRYTTDPDHGALIDHWHRTYCLTGGCVSFDDTTGVDAAAPPAAAPVAAPVRGAAPLTQPRRPVSLDSMMLPSRDSR
ncbi:MAG: hypothetical protein ACR2MQ_05495 [Gemmatimonadaceae bacterium]